MEYALSAQTSTYGSIGCARPGQEYGGSAHNFFIKVSTGFPVEEEQHLLVLTK